VSRYQKGKTNLDFTEARDGEWQWHQLGHMQVCTSLQTDNHASTPPLCFYSRGGSPSCRPTNSVKALKAKLHYAKLTQKLIVCNDWWQEMKISDYFCNKKIARVIFLVEYLQIRVLQKWTGVTSVGSSNKCNLCSPKMTLMSDTIHLTLKSVSAYL